jgi:Na+/H+ antiporter NhaD/arsenite permease-like protein
LLIVTDPRAHFVHEIAGSTTDSISQLLVAAVLVGLFATLAMERAHRVLVVLGAVALLWAITYLTPYHLLPLEAASRALDLNVLLLLAGMMALVGVLKATGVFGWAVDRLLDKFGHEPAHAIAVLWWFTAIASAFVDNVTTVIFVTPVAVATIRRLGVPSGLALIPLVMAANIGGAATLIGDPPNIMIGSGAGLPFMAFVKTLTLPTISMMCGLHWWGVRRIRKAMGPTADRPVSAEMSVARAGITDMGLLRWMGVITGGVLVGFVTHGFTGMPSAVPALLGATAALLVQDIRYLRAVRPTHEERRHGILEVLEKEIEWPTLTFFALLFMVVGAAVATGLTATMANALRGTILSAQASFGLSDRGTLIFAGLLVMWVSGALSAIMDNIPFVAVSIPIIAVLIGALPGDGTVLWWALALGACLGGNATPIGASANVTTLGLAERDGTRISFAEFARTGVKVTIFTLLVSSGYVVAFVLVGQAMAALIFAGVAAVGLAGVWVSERIATRA